MDWAKSFVAVVVGSLALNVSAGIVITKIDRGVGALARYFDDDVPPIPLLHQSSVAGMFDKVATAEYIDPADGDLASSTASQKSYVSVDRLTATGELSTYTHELTGVTSLFRVDFEVVTPQRYTLHYDLLADARGDYKGPTDAGTIVLLSSSGPVVGPETVQLDQSWQTPDPNVHAVFNGSGILNPGTYSLLMDLGYYGRYPNRDTLDYSLSMTFADSGTTAVPLPPAVWGGLITLGGIATARCFRRFRAITGKQCTAMWK